MSGLSCFALLEVGEWVHHDRRPHLPYPVNLLLRVHDSPDESLVVIVMWLPCNNRTFDTLEMLCGVALR